MSGWYPVIKTVKGHKYQYLQRTRREGKHVRTENVYCGPVSGGAGSSGFAYHGARDGLDGGIEPSEDGNYGPGVYLTTRDRAEVYASYYPDEASTIVANEAVGDENARPRDPSHLGTVHTYDLKKLNLFPVSPLRYQQLSDTLLGTGRDFLTPDEMADINARLAELGFDGIKVVDKKEIETIIFPESVDKLRPVSPRDMPGYTDQIVMHLTNKEHDTEEIEPSISLIPLVVHSVDTRDDIHADLEKIGASKRLSLRYYNEPGYDADTDSIQMPSKRLFRETWDETATQNYYGAYFHEVVHWTGHPERLDRLKTSEEEELADEVQEEITAELGAVMLMEHYGMATLKQGVPSRRAAYVQHYLSLIPSSQHDKILAAAKADAEKAVSYILDQL